jgi:hypothetical protein
MVASRGYADGGGIPGVPASGRGALFAARAGSRAWVGVVGGAVSQAARSRSRRAVAADGRVIRTRSSLITRYVP